MGACLIEKHISLSRQRKGLDIEFSLKGKEIKLLKNSIIKSWMLTKEKTYKVSSLQKQNLKFRRSIYSIADIKKGEKLSKQNIKTIRPGYGASPMKFDYFIGKKAIKNIKVGTPILNKLVK